MPLTNTQYDEIMRTYEKRQLDRQQLIDERKNQHDHPDQNQPSVASCHRLTSPAAELICFLFYTFFAKK